MKEISKQLIRTQSSEFRGKPFYAHLRINTVVLTNID